MYKIGICDDREDVLETISNMIEEVLIDPAEVFQFSSVKKLEEYYLRYGKCDILIMDIQVDEQDGIDIARRIQETYSDTKIIFITDCLEKAESIFYADPLAFLVKPVEKCRLKEALDKAVQKIEEENEDYVSFASRNKIVRVRCNDIYYVESDRRLLHIHGKELKQEIYGKLDEFLAAAPSGFLRSHKSYAVNMNKIKSFSADGIELCDGRIIPVSRPKYKEARESFLRFCGGGH